MYIYPRNFTPHFMRTPGMGAYPTPRRAAQGMTRLHRLHGLGASPVAPNVYVDPPSLRPSGPYTYLGQADANLPLSPVDPNLPLIANDPYTGAFEVLNQMQQQATVDTNPTDYTTPNAAIAAGLDPTTVNAVWASGLARFPTQAAAIAAGIAPGVVTSLWPASRAYIAPATTGLPSSISTYLPLALLGGVAFLAFSGGSGGSRRRR